MSKFPNYPPHERIKGSLLSCVCLPPTIKQDDTVYHPTLCKSVI